MTTLLSAHADSTVVLDERDHIGPHHLAIGKTRKLFEHDGVVHAFFSRGYAIGYARFCARTLALEDISELSLPVAWGGGAFCVDDDRAGGVCLVFLHRNQHELCAVRGTIENSRVRFGEWQTLLTSALHQAAPWVETGPDGTAWASVLDRSGDFRLAVIPREGPARIGDLFGSDEAPWYHSCVQVVPVGADEALAIGFRGVFPSKTELVFKPVSRSLAMGNAATVASCNVNDHLTFHFQASGDPERNRAHIAYLDEGLAISHAVYENEAWTTSRLVLPMACYAPQICCNDSGGLVLLAAGYDGAVRTACWNGNWTAARTLDGIAGPNISARFALTGYGTGGLISAARACEGRVPFLFARITDEMAGRARLEAGVMGHGRGLILSPGTPLAVVAQDGRVDITIALKALHPSDAQQVDAMWCVAVPAEPGRALKVVLTATGHGITGRAFWLERDGTQQPAAAVTITADYRDAFSPQDAALRATLQLPHPPPALQTDKARVETYRSQDGVSALVDLADCPQETAAAMAMDPSRISTFYKRMV